MYAEMIRLIVKPEQKEKAKAVLSILESRVKAKNLFGWRDFMEDLLSMTLNDMVTDSFKKTVPLYIYGGTQRAIDMSRICSAKKRRGDYESVSLSECFNPVDESADIVSDYEYRECQEGLYEAIKDKFGEEIARGLAPVIFGGETKVQNEIKKRCKTEEFRAFITRYRATRDK